jgi:hypothetical protein
MVAWAALLVGVWVGEGVHGCLRGILARLVAWKAERQPVKSRGQPLRRGVRLLKWVHRYAKR